LFTDEEKREENWKKGMESPAPPKNLARFSILLEAYADGRGISKEVL